MIVVRGEAVIKLFTNAKQEVFQVLLACGGSPNVVFGFTINKTEKAGPVNAFE